MLCCELVPVPVAPSDTTAEAAPLLGGFETSLQALITGARGNLITGTNHRGKGVTSLQALITGARG